MEFTTMKTTVRSTAILTCTRDDRLTFDSPATYTDHLVAAHGMDRAAARAKATLELTALTTAATVERAAEKREARLANLKQQLADAEQKAAAKREASLPDRFRAAVAAAEAQQDILDAMSGERQMTQTATLMKTLHARVDPVLERVASVQQALATFAQKYRRGLETMNARARADWLLGLPKSAMEQLSGYDPYRANVAPSQGEALVSRVTRSIDSTLALLDSTLTTIRENNASIVKLLADAESSGEWVSGWDDRLTQSLRDLSYTFNAPESLDARIPGIIGTLDAIAVLRAEYADTRPVLTLPGNELDKPSLDRRDQRELREADKDDAAKDKRERRAAVQRAAIGAVSELDPNDRDGMSPLLKMLRG